MHFIFQFYNELQDKNYISYNELQDKNFISYNELQDKNYISYESKKNTKLSIQTLFIQHNKKY